MISSRDVDGIRVAIEVRVSIDCAVTSLESEIIILEK